MRCSYWLAPILDDSDCYSIRHPNKKEVERIVKECGDSRFGPIVKVTVEGKSLFSILNEALGEGGLYAESKAKFKGEA